MDPMSALSLAACVVQFVQFASSLFNETRKIYNSSSGASEENGTLELIHGNLSDLCSRLETGCAQKARNVRLVALGLPKDAPSLADLAARCNEDCKQLLEIVDRMRTGNRSGPKIWGSFRVAMTEVLKAKEIERLQKRIENYQRLMILHLCSVSSGVIENTEAQVRALRFEMRSSQNQRSQQLQQLSQAIQEIRKRIEDFRTDQGKTSLTSEEIDTLTTKVSQLSLSGEEYAKENSLLRSLNYKQRSIRHENIPTAHQATFNWIFSEEGSKTKDTANLIEWLAKGQGVFWVSGRPGSGKSTLMKFLAGHPFADKLLSEWAGSMPIVKACHYFWSPGTDIQRSQEDMLRSLLYDILCHSSELIRLMCSERLSRMDPGRDPDFTSWSISELQSTIHRISSEIQLPFKICFFIDGMDQFAGSHLQLCESIAALSQYPSFKFLLSSRPWNEFEECFGKNPDRKLYLHELTKGDIQRYTESRLTEHPNWSFLVLKAGDEPARSLISDINSRSHGVFLWVFLVTGLLQQGLTNYDTLSELQTRLHEIPTDLGKFFRVILESVEPFYHTKMAGTLLLALTAHEPLPTTIYGFHDLEYEYPHYVLKEETRVWNREKFAAFELPLARRLSSRCKGLIEIQGRNVEFLHRTVRDFLRTAEMNDFLVKKAPDDFDASSSIVMAYAAWIKHKGFYGRPFAAEGNSEHVIPVLDKMLSYVDEEGSKKVSTVHDILNDVEWSLNQFYDMQTNESGLPSNASIVFRQRILRSNLAKYVAAKLDEDSTYLDGQKTPPLAIVLGQLGLERSISMPGAQCQKWLGHMKLIDYLLKRGHDPNQEFLPATPWIDFMQGLLTSDDYSQLAMFLDAGTISLLLDYGADVNAFIHVENNSVESTRTTVWVEFLLIGLPIKSRSSIMDCKEVYIEVLHNMLRVPKVALTDPSRSLNPSPLYSVTPQALPRTTQGSSG